MVRGIGCREVVRQPILTFNFLTVVLLLSLAGCASEEPSLVACPPDLMPIERAAPAFPPRLHNYYEGHAQVAFDVSKDGQVRQPEILSAEWTPVGRARGEPEGYEEAILSAMSHWRYAPVNQHCRTTARFDIRFEDPA